MHSRLFVTINKEGKETSEQVRQRVYDALLDDPSFIREGGRFGAPVADWFVIGGRFSGDLQKARLDQEKLKAVDAQFERQYGWWVGGEQHVTERQRQEQYRGLFAKHFPDYTGELPYWRDGYATFGAEDDAQPVDRQLYDALLDPFVGHTADQSDDDDDQWLFIDLDHDEVSPAFLGSKWLVVVDYHS